MHQLHSLPTNANTLRRVLYEQPAHLHRFSSTQL